MLQVNIFFFISADIPLWQENQHFQSLALNNGLRLRFSIYPFLICFQQPFKYVEVLRPTLSKYQDFFFPFLHDHVTKYSYFAIIKHRTYLLSGVIFITQFVSKNIAINKKRKYRYVRNSQKPYSFQYIHGKRKRGRTVFWSLGSLPYYFKQKTNCLLYCNR